jgi:glycosyltransferase involved in cell wall biosynthesis
MRLGDVKARDKLRPLLDCPAVERVVLVRHAPVELESPKLTQLIHDSRLDQGVRKMSVWRSLRNLSQCVRHGVAAVRRERLDAVVGFNLTPYGVVAWWIARRTGRPSLAALIGADFNTRLDQPGLRRPLQAVLRRCSRVTIFSQSAKRELERRGLRPGRVFVLPNTVDTKRYRPDPAVAKDYDLVFTGYLIPRKGVDRLLAAVARLAERGPPVRCLIIGDGIERERLEAEARRLEVAERVKFAGWSADVAGQVRRARVFVLLSAAEGLPIALLEAMASGLPAVVTDVGANADVVRDGVNGYLVPHPADPAEVADRLARLLDDPAHYAAASAAALGVRQTHGYEKTAATWTRVLAGLTDTGR